MTAEIKITEPHVQLCVMAISQQVGAKAKHRGPYHFLIIGLIGSCSLYLTSNIIWPTFTIFLLIYIPLYRLVVQPRKKGSSVLSLYNKAGKPQGWYRRMLLNASAKWGQKPGQLGLQTIELNQEGVLVTFSKGTSQLFKAAEVTLMEQVEAYFMYNLIWGQPQDLLILPKNQLNNVQGWNQALHQKFASQQTHP